ncbi:MAG: ComEA family DNA-binding protein [Dehalococcoidia bacterium]|nr:MAG: ComEA family DNA-binding protein [Dehalococcoidia bacterium]
MTTSKFSKYWTLLIILLVAIITVGGIVAWSRYSGSQPTEISISKPPSQEQLNKIYIGGAVNNPGFYPLKAGDSIEALIQAAGGTITNANLSGLKLYILPEGEEEEPQKINLNRAEVWLLKALPGIGETLAQRIVDYRHQNGPFQNINELIKIEGVGTTTYEQIKHLITVAN